MTNKIPFSQPIIGATSHTVGSFWQWAYSDILSNRNRSIFTEYLVGCAIGVVDEGVREEWASHDLLYNGKKIEIKSSAYLQAWPQKALSKPRFDIAKKSAFDAEKGNYSTQPSLNADYFVFCLFATNSMDGANVLDINQWRFFVVSTDDINLLLGNPKSLSLQAVKMMAQESDYGGIRARLDELILAGKP